MLVGIINLSSVFDTIHVILLPLQTTAWKMSLATTDRIKHIIHILTRSYCLYIPQHNLSTETAAAGITIRFLTCDRILMALGVSLNYNQLAREDYSKRAVPTCGQHPDKLGCRICRDLWQVASCLKRFHNGHNRAFLLTHKLHPIIFLSATPAS